MSAQEVRDRLDDRFRLLSGSRRGSGAPPDAAPRGAVVLRPARRRRADGAGALFGVRRRVRPRRRRRTCAATASTSTRCWICWTRWCASRWSPSSGRRPYPLRDAGDDPPVRRGATRRHRHDRRRSGIVMPATSPSRPSPTGSCGTGPASGTRSTGSTPSSPTCAPGSAGPPTRATSPPPPPSPPTPRLLASPLQRFEPVGWAEEILAAATAADLPQLPRLYTAASLCLFTGRADAGRRLRPGRGRPWRPIPATTPSNPDGAASGRPSPTSSPAGSTAAGDLRRPRRPARARSRLGLVRAVYVLPVAGRADGGHGDRRGDRGRRPRPRQPFWIACALAGYGRAFAETDPARALTPASGPRLRPGAPHAGLGRRSSGPSRRSRSRPRETRAGPA